MRSVTVQEAKTHLSRLLREVEAGEQIEIRRGDTPIAVLTAKRAVSGFAALEGKFEGQMEIPPDFDAEDEDILRDFGMID